MKISVRIVLFTLLLLSVPGICISDTLYLKDGRTIQSDTIWEEDGYYMYTAYGATVGISKEKVSKVDYSRQNNQSNSFQFDIWPFGTTVAESINIAERHNVPLHKSGIITINKGFHPQVRKYSDATHFYYNTNLLGHFSKVELYFTPVSKKLHSVKIQWPNQKTKDSKLANEIISMISEKHGKPERHGKRRLFYSDTEWITQDGNQIQMSVSSTAMVIFLSYLHTNLRQLDYEETENLKLQKIKSGAARDKNKF
jgi:hypothetical protein